MMSTMRQDRPLFPHAELRLESSAEQIMAMPAVRPHRWTIADVDRLVEERDGMSPRYELVDGELLVTPGPTWRHQRIILRLALILQPYLSRHGLGEALLGPAELKLATGERYEPDLFVIPWVEGRRLAAEGISVPPLLVCEVLSPGSSRHDRITKRRAFQRNGIPEYWIVDGDAAAFEIWRPDEERPTLVDDHLVWSPAGASEPLDIDVAAFFAGVVEYTA